MAKRFSREELLRMIGSGKPYESTNSPWKVNRETLVLYIERRREVPHDPDERDFLSYYEVDLEEVDSPASALDWICQLAQKPWITDAILGAFVRNLDRIFSFQATMCCGGVCCVECEEES
jgi:hypothetical protein